MPRFLEPPYPPFTPAQAAAEGISRHRLRTLVNAREVRRVLRGAYQASMAPDTLVARAAAAALVMPPQGVLCDRTAAWIHGVDTLRWRELEVLPPLDVVVCRGARSTHRAQWRNGERDLSPHDVTEVAGVSVTTPLRTSLDLGCKLPKPAGLAALDSFMRLHGLTHDDFYDELPRYVGRRGVVRLRSLLPLADPRSESPAESWIRMIIVDAGLPLPELQHVVIRDGYRSYRLDLAYPRHLVCVEYDGVEFHAGELAMAADGERRSWLRAQGWTILVLTRADLESDAVDRWTSQLRALLHRRTPWPRG